MKLGFMILKTGTTGPFAIFSTGTWLDWRFVDLIGLLKECTCMYVCIYISIYTHTYIYFVNFTRLGGLGLLL